MRQDLIEMLRSGKAALLNNPAYEKEIVKILRAAFPQDLRSLKMTEDIVENLCEKDYVYAFVRWWDSKTWDFVENEDRYYDFGYLHPKDFFIGKKESPYDLIDEAIKKAEMLNKELRETLKLKKELAEFDIKE